MAGAHSRALAATLACGETAILSHRSAAALWGLLTDSGDIVDVTVDNRTETRPGILVHRSRLRRDEIGQRQGVPVTTPARTLLDLAGMVTERAAGRVVLARDTERAAGRVVVARDVERALAEAFAQRLTTRRAMQAMLARRDGRGKAILRELLESDTKPALTRSEAEEQFLDLVRRGGLADPAVNVMVERYEVDFLWASERVIVEVDGHRYHASRTAFENDRRRDALLTAAGYIVMRVTWDQLTHEPEAILVRLVRTLCNAQTERTGRQRSPFNKRTS